MFCHEIVNKRWRQNFLTMHFRPLAINECFTILITLNIELMIDTDALVINDVNENMRFFQET